MNISSQEVLGVQNSFASILQALTIFSRKELLAELTESEFIDFRVNAYVQQLETAIVSVGVDFIQAKEIAFHEVTVDLL